MKRLCRMCHKPTGSRKPYCKTHERTKKMFDDVIEARRDQLRKEGMLPRVETIRNVITFTNEL